MSTRSCSVCNGCIVNSSVEVHWAELLIPGVGKGPVPSIEARVAIELLLMGKLIEERWPVHVPVAPLWPIHSIGPGHVIVESTEPLMGKYVWFGE